MGPQGPQGLAGISGQQVVSTGLLTVNLLANQQTTLEVVCPAGKRVFGGGYESNANAVVHPLASFPPNVTTWRVVLRLSQDTSATFTFRVYAVCATAN
jgi:hypothetical protein